MLPAVVAAAVVEINQPDAFDFDAELDDSAGPVGDDALRFGGGLVAFGQRIHFGHGRGGDAARFRQQRGRLFVGEGPAVVQRCTSSSHFSNFSLTLLASSARLERRKSSSIFATRN